MTGNKARRLSVVRTSSGIRLGEGESAPGFAAFPRDAPFGLLSVRASLLSRGVKQAGWRPVAATEISADGRTMVDGDVGATRTC